MYGKKRHVHSHTPTDLAFIYYYYYYNICIYYLYFTYSFRPCFYQYERVRSCLSISISPHFSLPSEYMSFSLVLFLTLSRAFYLPPHMTDSSENATTPKSAILRNLNSSYKFELNQNCNFDFCHEIMRNVDFSIWWVSGR